MSMTLIEHIEVGSGGAASISFVSVGDIPSDYTDLLVVLSGRSTAGANVDGIRIALNGSTSNLTHRRLIGGGSGSGGSASGTNGEIGLISAANNTANTFGNCQIYIPNYRSTSAKSISADSVSENNSTEAYQGIYAMLWNPASNVPITSITLDMLGGNLVQYSSATLYGITAGSDGTTTVS